MDKPDKVMSIEAKQFFKENILTLMMNCDSKLVPTIKSMIVSICKEGGGYLNAWPELIKVIYI